MGSNPSNNCVCGMFPTKSLLGYVDQDVTSTEAIKTTHSLSSPLFDRFGADNSLTFYDNVSHYQKEHEPNLELDQVSLLI